MRNKKNKSILMFITLSVLIAGILGYVVYDNNLSREETKDQDTFSIETTTGKAIIIEYTTVGKITEHLYDSGYEYVYFNIIESNSRNFLTFIEDLKGNGFVSERAIGVGCLENDNLTYVNDSDEFGMKEYNLTREDTKKIMDATKEKPVKLELEKKKLTNGGFAPECYSHITTIKVID